MLERAFKIGTYSLKNILMEMVSAEGGAYTHDGDFIFSSDMEAEKEDFCDMVYRHCREVETAKNSDDEALFNPHDQPDTPESLRLRRYVEAIDRTDIPNQITQKTYDLIVSTERFYWELLSAKKEVLELLGEARNAAISAAKEIEAEIFDPGRGENNFNQRLLIYAEKFRLALLNMSDWYGLYRYSLKKEWAYSELVKRGYKQNYDVPGLTINPISFEAVTEKNTTTDSLPKLTCAKLFAPGYEKESPVCQVERTRHKNESSRQVIEMWRKVENANGTRRYSDEDIAKQLQSNGGGIAVIGALLKEPMPPTKEACRDAGKRLLGKKN